MKDAKIFRSTVLLTWVCLLLSCIDLPPSTINESSIANTPEGFDQSFENLEAIKFICPEELSSVEEKALVDGKLLYWDYPSLYTLSFPGLLRSKVRNADLPDVSFSPDHQSFVTIGEQSGGEINLTIVNSNDQITAVIPWQEDWEGNPIWATNGDIWLRRNDGRSIAIYDPRLGVTYNKTFSFPDENTVHIVATDHLYETATYISSRDSSGFINWNSLRVWDEKDQSFIFNLDNGFSSIASDVKLSNEGNKIAVTTVTPDENSNHSEIIVIDINRGISTQISEFRSYYNYVIIPDIQWSPDDNLIYFWPFTSEVENKSINMFSVDVQTGEVIQYCFKGSLRSENFIVWISNNPRYYLTRNMKNHNSTSDSSEEEWSLLLVDSFENKSYTIDENTDLLGWLIND